MHSRFRETSLLDFLTDTTCSSPSGTSRSRDPVPRFTGTKELQSIANKPINALNRDLRISLMASTKPPFEFKSNGFRRPDLFGCCNPIIHIESYSFVSNMVSQFLLHDQPPRSTLSLQYCPSHHHRPPSRRWAAPTKLWPERQRGCEIGMGYIIGLGKHGMDHKLKQGTPQKYKSKRLWEYAVQTCVWRRFSISSGPIAK